LLVGCLGGDVPKVLIGVLARQLDQADEIIDSEAPPEDSEDADED
jgi:hypothetical protein